MNRQPLKSLRPRRVFSEEAKRSIVKEIESGKLTVEQARREYGVASQSVYNWIYKFSRYLQKNKVMVIEEQSEASRSRDLEKRIKELEAALGRKSLEIDVLNTLIDLANKDFKVDIKKNFGPNVSNSSESKSE